MTEAHGEPKNEPPFTRPIPDPPKPLPHVPPSPDLSAARSILFLAQDINASDLAPSYYARAYTADRAYARPSPADVAARRARGIRQFSWCDCRTTLPAEAIEMASELGLDGWIGQGEQAAEFDNAIGAGAKIVIGNFNSLRADQLALVVAAKVLWIQEDYWNCGDGVPDWHGWPIAGSCVAVYGDSQCSRKPISDYIAAGRFTPGRDSVYGPGMTEADYHNLP